MALLTLGLALSGCSRQSGNFSPLFPTTGANTAPNVELEVEPEVELEKVPFYPQRTNHCGPAALATVASFAGAEVDVDQFAKQVYLPGKEGSLQYDLLGAARRNNLVPYVIDSDPQAIANLLHQGYPVLVLQNLGLKILPRWHYAVVIGYQPKTGHFILRSGNEHRKKVPHKRFLSSWRKAGAWGVVVLQPEQIPAGIDKSRYLEALTVLEGIARPTTMIRAFEAAAQRWPSSDRPVVGLGNAYYAAGQLAAAEATFRKLLSLQPQHLVARNNLAHLLAKRDCLSAALAEAELAIRAVDTNHPLWPSLKDTMEEIKALQAIERSRPPNASPRNIPGAAPCNDTHERR